MEYQHFGENFGSNILHQWKPDFFIRFNQQYILLVSEKISTDTNCKFRQVTLRVFIYLLANIDNEGKISINARQLSKNLGVHYDTITKCIKYLKDIDFIKTEK